MNVFEYNVNFGDSFLLEYEEENLLIDMGTIGSNVDFRAIWEDINTKCSGKALSVMLTHFHEDHMVGLLERKIGDQSIKNIYLPNFLKLKMEKEFDYVKLSIYADFFNNIMLNERKHITLYDLIRILYSSGAITKFLECGTELEVSSKKFMTLWPIPELIPLINQSDWSEIEEILDAVLEENSERLTEWGYYGRKDILPHVDDNENPIKRLVHNVEEQIKIIFIEHLHDGSLESGNWYETLTETVQQLIDIQEMILLDPIHRNKVKLFLNKFSSVQNKLSIVFHNMVDEKDNVLFTGDIKIRQFKSFIAKNTVSPLHSHYKIIKAPHHGTEPHFIKTLPDCEYILISNGKTSLSGYKKIYREYGTLYHTKKSVNIMCTNGWCEQLDMGFQCMGMSQCGKEVLGRYVL